MIPYNQNFVSNSRILRKNMTPEERHLWYDFLKKLPITVKRQHIIENYIIDFYIANKKIAIEIDGSQHGDEEHLLKDQERDKTLLRWGIKVLRYTNKEINSNFNSVAEDILKNIGLDFKDLKNIY